MTWIPVLVAISSLVAMGAAVLPVVWAWAVAGGVLARRPAPALPVHVAA